MILTEVSEQPRERKGEGEGEGEISDRRKRVGGYVMETHFRDSGSMNSRFSHVTLDSPDDRHATGRQFLERTLSRTLSICLDD